MAEGGDSSVGSSSTVIYGEWLCGQGDSFWNSSSSWDAARPTVGTCFQAAVWTFPPAAVFWLLLPLSLWSTLGRRGRRGRQPVLPRWSILFAAKITVNAGLAVIAVWDIIGALMEDPAPPPVRLLEPPIRLATLMGATAAIVVHSLRAVASSALMWLFWGGYVFTSALLAAHYLTNMGSPSLQLPVSGGPASFFTSAALLTLNFLLTFWSDKTLLPPPTGHESPGADGDDEGGKEAYSQYLRADPEKDSSFPSKLTFAWFTDLAWRGFRKDLTMDDIWDLHPSNSSVEVFKKFEKHLHRSSDVRKRGNVYVNAKGVGSGDAANEIEMKEANHHHEKQQHQQQEHHEGASKKRVSIVPPLVCTFGWVFLGGSVMKAVQDMMLFIPPILLKRIIEFVASDAGASLWKGVLYCILLLVVTGVQTLLLSQYFYKMYLVGLRVRSALTAAIYKKSLLISLSSHAGSSIGEIVNLMSVDIQRIVDMMPYWNMVWSSPFQIITSVYFLWQELGPSVLAGLFTMIFLIPVNGFIAAKVKSFQIAQMKEKDKRVKHMNEILQGIKILKLYAWEPSFQKQVIDIRHKEIKILRRMGYLQAGTSFVWTCAPFLVSLVSFATYVLVDENNVLDAKKAFVSLSLFNILRFPLTMLPMIITGLVQANVATKRINKFMNAEEVESEVQRLEQEEGKDAIEIESGTFEWAGPPPGKKEGKDEKKDEKKKKKTKKKEKDEEDKENEEEKKALTEGDASPDAKEQVPTLRDISINVKRGSLMAIVGTVGAGKTSVLSALLGEMKELKGRVVIRGSISYVPQQAWIQNATVRDNVLFGQTFDKAKYERVIMNSALEDDLEMLPAGDMTEIGEKGINLSGGQKQRVSLARALYSETDIYLLDDPLSAVDAHVGKALFERAIGPNGCLAGKTRVLVTHGMTYLPRVDVIVVIKDGTVSEVGSYKELLERKGAFAEILIQYISEHEEAQEEEDDLGDLKKAMEQCLGREELRKQISRCRTTSEGEHCKSVRSTSLCDSQLSGEGGPGESKPTEDLLTKKVENGGPGQTEEKDKGKQQYQEEKVETGNVSFKVFLYYIKSMGYPISAACFLCFSLYQVFNAYSSIWLSEWSDLHESESHRGRDLYLGVYGLLGIGQAAAAVSGSICLYLATLGGAEKLHHHTLESVLKAPMAFFDTTPQGRILNRFGKDVDVLDATMPMILRGWITCFLAVISTFLIICYTTPIFMVPLAVFLVCYFFVQRVYVASSRQLKRLESVSRSPIYSHFGETLNGIQTIRAFSAEEKSILESQRRVDLNMKVYWPSIVANRWLAVRLEMVGNLIIFCSALFAVMAKGTITPGLVGLSVSYALSVTQTLNWLVRMTSEVETNVVAVERLKEYAETPSEASWRNDASESKKDDDWPSEGKIEFADYSTRYRDGLALALREVSFTCSGSQRVGIVGRTGAGKSSLTMGLFRLIEPAGGKILIDGVDVSTLGLHDLRSKLSIIPQDPVLFAGSLRMNLDPFDQYSDEEVTTALRQAHLGDFLESSPGKLAFAVQEGGSNLSVGQRQLVCLGRALLKRSKVLVLDEATAAVDVETDEVIQGTIREQFSNSTIITIAHRLNTIIDYDKIVVLSTGSIKEFDSPENLLKDKSSAFYAMCKEAKLVD